MQRLFKTEPELPSTRRMIQLDITSPSSEIMFNCLLMVNTLSEMLSIFIVSPSLRVPDLIAPFESKYFEYVEPFIMIGSDS